MSEVIGKLLRNLQVNHVWLFLTERCNLACDYCFFGGRDGRTTISLDQVKALFGSIPRKESYDVVISGGEPLLEWRRSQEVIRFVHSFTPASRLMIQTNGLLLDQRKIAFIKTYRVGLEFGIDGPQAANSGHRRGMSGSKYGCLIRNIHNAVAAGIRTCATMTVHPREVESMEENYRALSELGFASLEVHPAFMAPWSDSEAKAFVSGYGKILALDIKTQADLISPYYSRNVPPLLDLVVQPDGMVLPNWTYLIFPKVSREPFYLMDIGVGGKRVEIRAEAMASYLKALRNFFVLPHTYREFSNFNARRILAFMKDSRLSRVFHSYEKAAILAQELDLRCLKAREKAL
jgi:MoaA/NifB/PqqE/SkfB family radical SAM enzyme